MVTGQFGLSVFFWFRGVLDEVEGAHEPGPGLVGVVGPPERTAGAKPEISSHVVVSKGGCQHIRCSLATNVREGRGRLMGGSGGGVGLVKGADP